MAFWGSIDIPLPWQPLAIVNYKESGALRLRDASEKQRKMEWFLRRGNGVEGPLAEGDLRVMLESGVLPPDLLVSTNRHDFRPLSEWEIFRTPSAVSPPPNSAATQILGSAPAASDLSGLGIGSGSSADLYRGEAAPAQGKRATAVIGSPVDPESILAGAHSWPGSAQHDPDEREKEPLPTVPASSEEKGQTFFESVPQNSPQSKNDLEEPRPPLPARPLGYVPAPPLPPVKNTIALLPVLTGAIAVFVLCAFGALAADRLLRGPTTSNISRYLPAGAPFYLEVPSFRRLSRDIAQIEFVRRENWQSTDILERLSKEVTADGLLSEIRGRRLASIDSLAVTRIEKEFLFALKYERAEEMTEYLAALSEKPKKTEWGLRYLTSGHRECVWLSADLVEICGTGTALERSLQVLSGRTPSAEEDTHLNAAKKRDLWSYFPFVDVPTVYATGDPTLFLEHSPFRQVSGATVAAGLDDKGYVEKLELLFEPGKAPRSFPASAPLTLFRDLPEGTLFYANFRAHFPKTSQEFDEEVAGVLEFPRGAPVVKQGLARVRDTLGFHPSELSKGFAPEGLIAATFPPESQLTDRDGEQLRGAIWLLQTIDDHGQVRRTLNALVERFSEDRSTLLWKDEHNLVGSDPSGFGIHLRLENNLLRIGIGHPKELSRVLARPPPLANDPAHEAALIDFGKDVSALAWLDLGRFLSEARFDEQLSEAEKKIFEKLAASLHLTGSARPVAAWSVHQLDTGDLRIRSLNFPTAFVFFALGELGRLGPKDEKEPEGIGSGRDGSFPLPPL